MGSGGYSFASRSTRATNLGFHTKSIHETFSARELNNAMNPKGVTLRESCDSEEHPESLAIILALDVTGSMGSVPHHLVKDGLPHIMSKIIERGYKDPQLLFMGVGDHKTDQAPLQIGQFESSDELLDKWLTDIWLEGNGGGNQGESYFLPWYFAGHCTKIDCFIKRQKKGYLFTVGDEDIHTTISKSSMTRIFGAGEFNDEISAMELLDKAKEMYHVYHIHITETGAGSRPEWQNHWKEILGDHFIPVKSSNDVSKVIPDIIYQEVDPGREPYKPAAPQSETQTAGAPQDDII